MNSRWQSLIAKLRGEPARPGPRLPNGENLYRQLIETAEEGIWMLDPTGITLYANTNMEKLLGCPEGLLGRSVFDFVFEEDRAEAADNLRWRLQGNSSKYEFSLRRTDGGAVHILISSSPSIGLDGRVTGILVLITDVTELVAVRHQVEQLNRQLEARVQERTRELEASNLELAREMVAREYAQQALEASNERLNYFLHELKLQNESVTRLNLLSDQLHCCDSRAELLRVLERSCRELFGSEGGALLEWREGELGLIEAPWGTGIAHGWQWADEVLQTLQQGQLFPPAGDGRSAPATSQLVCAPLQSRGSGVGVLTLLRSEPFWREDSLANDKFEQTLRALADHTALALNNLSLRDQLREQSVSDPLTGLYNRRYLYEQMDNLIALWGRTEQPFALILIDVDHFKLFNDRYGHDVGDAVLINVSDLLRYQVRRSDVACRMGGEEFVVLMAGAGEQLALQRAEDIRQALAQLRIDGIGTSPVTVSAGVALFPTHGDDAFTLLRAADRALYESKRGGRDRITLARRGEP